MNKKEFEKRLVEFYDIKEQEKSATTDMLKGLELQFEAFKESTNEKIKNNSRSRL